MFSIVYLDYCFYLPCRPVLTSTGAWLIGRRQDMDALDFSKNKEVGDEGEGVERAKVPPAGRLELTRLAQF